MAEPVAEAPLAPDQHTQEEEVHCKTPVPVPEPDSVGPKDVTPPQPPSPDAGTDADGSDADMEIIPLDAPLHLLTRSDDDHGNYVTAVAYRVGMVTLAAVVSVTTVHNVVESPSDHGVQVNSVVELDLSGNEHEHRWELYLN